MAIDPNYLAWFHDQEPANDRSYERYQREIQLAEEANTLKDTINLRVQLLEDALTIVHHQDAGLIRDRIVELKQRLSLIS